MSVALVDKAGLRWWTEEELDQRDYYFKRRLFGILPARKQKDEEITLTEINEAVEKLTYHYTWERYERLYRDRIAKANNLLSALQNKNKVFVDHDYYKLILR